MFLLLLSMVCAIPPEAELVLEVPLDGDAWAETVRENDDGSYTLKIVTSRNEYGGECLETSLLDFDFLTLTAGGDTLGLTTHASTDAYMLWDAMEMRDGQGYVLYGDFREIPEDMGEPDWHWYDNQTFPFSAFQVCRVSMDGDTLWRKRWHQDSLSNGMAARLLSDNSVLVSTQVETGTAEWDAHLHHISPSGDLLWQRTIEDWQGVYPYDIASNGNSLMMVEGPVPNRHTLIDLATGEVLRVDTLPPEESIHLTGCYPMNQSDLLTCRLRDPFQGPTHIAGLFGEGIGDDRIWSGPSLEELGLIELVVAACHVEGSSWAMLGASSWENPTIVLALMDGLGTTMATLELGGMTGVPDQITLEELEVDSEFFDMVEWGYRPVESLQYTGNGRFVTGIDNFVMIQGVEPLRCIVWVLAAEPPEA